MTEPQERLQALLRHFDNAMLVTTSKDDMLRARPMRIAAREDEAGLWFLTSHSASKTEDLEEDIRAAVTMQGERRYLSLTGMASVVTDRAKKEELWSAAMRPWFPTGVEDPDLVAIRFVPTEAEYWDSSGLNGVRYLIDGVRAIVKGERVDTDDPARHGAVAL